MRPARPTETPPPWSPFFSGSHRGNTSPGLTWEETDDRAVMSGPGLRLTLARFGDRWTHRLGRPGEDEKDIACAVESDLERDSPARVVSPVYQEIHRHERPEAPGLCLLLTGRLFQHHFSAAVNLRIGPDRLQTLVLDIDVADRCRAPVQSVAATYSVGFDSSALVDAGPQLIAWEADGRCPGRLELLADPPCTLALAEAGRRASRVQVLAAIQPATFTYRLRYRWRWTKVSDASR
jgi:hypothetical protein